MLKRTLFASVLALYWVIGEAVNWQTGSITLTSQVSAASIFLESSELPISSTVTTPRKLIRRPAIALIPLPSPPPETTPSVPSSPSHTLIQRPSVSPVPSLPSSETTPQISVNVPGKLIRRPSVGLASATASVPTPGLTAAYAPQTASQPVNGVIASIVPSAESTTAGNTKSKNTAQAAIALGSATAPIFAPSFQSTLASTPVNPTPFASVGQLFAAPQSGANPASYPRKLTQRPEVAAILAPPAQASSAVPTINRNPGSLTFTGVQGGANPLPQTLSITNTGSGTLSWSASVNASWLSLSPSSGTTTTEADTITATVNTSGLTANTYTATITIIASVATNSPRTVPVTLTLTSPLLPGIANLTWGASTSSNVAGYNVYVGTSSGVYGPSINVGNVTSYQVVNLAAGQTYFFAVTAYNASGIESGFSNEASKSIF